MCGIITIKTNDKKSLVRKLKKTFENQKTRGTEGFGFVALVDNKVVAYKRATTEKGIFSHFEKLPDQTNAIIFHHRYPTSTINLSELAHPFKVVLANKDILYFVHNGVISNSHELRAEHEKQGKLYTTLVKTTNLYNLPNAKKDYTQAEYDTFNDSETLAFDFADYLNGKQAELKARGSIALVALVTSPKGIAKSLYYGRGTNPLGETKGDNYFCLASQKGKDIKQNTLFCYDYQTQKTSQTPLYLGYVKPTPKVVGFEKPYTQTKWTNWDNDYKYSKYHALGDYTKDDEIIELQAELDDAIAKKDDDMIAFLRDEIETLRASQSKYD